MTEAVTVSSRASWAMTESRCSTERATTFATSRSSVARPMSWAYSSASTALRNSFTSAARITVRPGVSAGAL